MNKRLTSPQYTFSDVFSLPIVYTSKQNTTVYMNTHGKGENMAVYYHCIEIFFKLTLWLSKQDAQVSTLVLDDLKLKALIRNFATFKRSSWNHYS